MAIIAPSLMLQTLENGRALRSIRAQYLNSWTQAITVNRIYMFLYILILKTENSSLGLSRILIFKKLLQR